MRLTDILRGARALWRCLWAGRVDFNKASNRATHCANCPWLLQKGGWWVRLVSWTYERLFPPCGHGEPWQTRQPWKCRLCSCALRVKMRLPIEFILRHTTTDLYDRLPREICWIRFERAQLDASPKPEQE